jgi:hypothetical protein
MKLAESSYGSLSLKIAPAHLERLAVVYVRQATARQVLENRESTTRQYALADSVGIEMASHSWQASHALTY